MFFKAFFTFALLGAGAIAMPQSEKDSKSDDAKTNNLKTDDSQSANSNTDDSKALRGGATDCGNNNIGSGKWQLYNNPWGAAYGNGRSCTTVSYVNGNDIGFSTAWTWDRGTGQVKSYPNAKQFHNNVSIRNLRSLATSVDWNLGCNERTPGASIVYDIFLNSGGRRVEVMVWLGAPSAHPIAGSYNGGKPVPTLSGVRVRGDGYTYDLFIGPGPGVDVYSFVISGTLQENGGRWTKQYSSNLANILKFLTTDRRLGNKRLSVQTTLESSQFGIETTVGTNCKFTVNKLSIAQG